MYMSPSCCISLCKILGFASGTRAKENRFTRNFSFFLTYVKEAGKGRAKRDPTEGIEMVFLLLWLLMPACSGKTGKSLQILDISFQSLAIIMPCAFSILQAVPWSVFMVSGFVICFFLFCLQTFSLRYFRFSVSQHYGSINIYPKLQYELGSCSLHKKFLFCCQGLISFTAVLLCLPLSLSWKFEGVFCYRSQPAVLPALKLQDWLRNHRSITNYDKFSPSLYTFSLRTYCSFQGQCNTFQISITVS